MALINMGNGEKITLEEYNLRSRQELENFERQWQQKFEKPNIVQILEKAEEVLKRRLAEVTNELEQLELDDQILTSVGKLHQHEMGWKLDMWAAGQHFCPFFVSVYHHRNLRKKLEERVGEYKQTLQHIKRLRKGKLAEVRDAKLSEFESPL